MATEFYDVNPSIYGSVWNKLHVTTLLPGILAWLLDFLKNRARVVLNVHQYASTA
jgi:hypothetical protein